MRLRHFVLPLIAISGVYLGLQALTTTDLSASEKVDMVFNTPHTYADDNNLKSAFDLQPPPAALAYDETRYAKPVVTANAANGKSSLTKGISKIQSGLTTLLQAGTDILVSTKTVAVGKGDTLMALLVRNNVPREEAYEAIQALSRVYDPRDLNPGHEVTVFFHQDPSIADPKFSGLSIEKDPVSTVKVNRSDDGSYKADQQEKTVSSRLRAFRGTIDGSLYMSAKAQGVPDGVILDLIKMYSLNVDFQRDIQPGNVFEVMYEEFTTQDGDVVPGKGNIVYAKMELDDRTLPFFRFKDSSGEYDYYDDKGRTAKRALMRTPIDGARLTSGFGMRRHPVLGYSKMHKGVDFAAPRGTPIYAAGDGTIVKIGPFSSFGNYVRIRHRSGLDTAYAHMNGFKPGLKNGSKVKQGQVIGYVGTTGRSTGPHLHYEVLVNNQEVNPNSIKTPTAKTLAGKDLKNFKGTISNLSHSFASAVGADAADTLAALEPSAQ